MRDSVSANSAFWLKMQADAVLLVDVLDLEMPAGNTHHWTNANAPITYTLSGASTRYDPFPGGPVKNFQQDINLGVAIVDFLMVNTHTDIQQFLTSDDFQNATVKFGRVFSDTPDLGRLDEYWGTMGDFVYNRLTLNGQVRNLWKSLNINWPLYAFQDRCGWKFGSTGCGKNVTSLTVALNSVNVGSSTILNILVASGYLTQSYANGRFDFGKVSITAGPNSGHTRAIRIHTGDLLGLSHNLPVNSMTGTTLSIYPGCRKTLIADCNTLYNNTTNFLGWPWIPRKD